MSLQDIIARLEKATGPDRELDALIACAVRHTDLRPARPDDFDGKYGCTAGDLKTETGFIQAYRYTSSVDDALTLVPEGWTCLVRSRDRTEHQDFARVESPDFESVCWEAGDKITMDVTAGTDASARGATLALALCIAALKARCA